MLLLSINPNPFNSQTCFWMWFTVTSYCLIFFVLYILMMKYRCFFYLTWSTYLHNPFSNFILRKLFVSNIVATNMQYYNIWRVLVQDWLHKCLCLFQSEVYKQSKPGTAFIQFSIKLFPSNSFNHTGSQNIRFSAKFYGVIEICVARYNKYCCLLYKVMQQISIWIFISYRGWSLHVLCC